MREEFNAFSHPFHKIFAATEVKIIPWSVKIAPNTDSVGMSMKILHFFPLCNSSFTGRCYPICSLLLPGLTLFSAVACASEYKLSDLYSIGLMGNILMRIFFKIGIIPEFSLNLVFATLSQMPNDIEWMKSWWLQKREKETTFFSACVIKWG